MITVYKEQERKVTQRRAAIMPILMPDAENLARFLSGKQYQLPESTVCPQCKAVRVLKRLDLEWYVSFDHHKRRRLEEIPNYHFFFLAIPAYRCDNCSLTFLHSAIGEVLNARMLDYCQRNPEGGIKLVPRSFRIKSWFPKHRAS